MTADEVLTPMSPEAPKIVRVRVTVEDALGHTRETEESAELTRRVSNRHTRQTAKELAAATLEMLEKAGDWKV